MSNKKKLDYSRKYECPNVDCGVETYLKIERAAGWKETILAAFLLFLYIIPGIIYIIYFNKYRLKYSCPKCNFDISADYIKHRNKEKFSDRNNLLKIALIVLIILGIVGTIYLSDKNEREKQLIRTINRSVY